MAYSDLHRDLLLQQLLDEMVAARSTSTDLNTRLDSIEAYLPYILKSDGTDSQVLRSSKLIIDNGTNANTLKCTLTSNFNGDTIAETDNIAKNATTGNYTLDTNGYVLLIEAAGLTGNAVKVLNVSILSNASGAAVTCDFDVATNDISLHLKGNTDASSQDMTSLVDTGAISLMITYITSA